MDGVALSGSKPHLLEYIRSLQHYLIPGTETSYWMRNLHNIHSLKLGNATIVHISKEEFHTRYSAFRETLLNLNLQSFVTSFSAFVTLVDYFPNLTTLRLGSFTVKPDEEPVPTLSRPLRGRIHLNCTSRNCAEFFDRLAKLDPGYEELELDSESRVETKLVESVLRLCARTVKYLRLTARFEREHPYDTSSSLDTLTKIPAF